MVERADTEAEASPEEDGAGPLMEDIDLKKLDAQYKPIDSFETWAKLSVDDDMWTRHVESLGERKDQLQPEDMDRALEVATRTAAVDTGAIEGLYETDRGLTLSIATKIGDWETQMRTRNESMPDFVDAQISAYGLAYDVAAENRPITEVWIRELHEVVTKPQANYKARSPQGWIDVLLPKGEYKKQPNHVQQEDGSKHAYAPVDMTPPEMQRLVEELSGPDFETAHPVLQAAYCHYALVAIHPFADGNGRVARAVASVFLRRQALIPLVIQVDQRTDYFNALEAADRGERQRFADFVFDRGVDALTLVTNQLGPDPGGFISALSRLHLAREGLTYQELDEQPGKIIAHVRRVAKEFISESRFPRGVTAEVLGGIEKGTDIDPAYRHPLQAPAVLRVNIKSAAPAQADLSLNYRALVAKDRSRRYALRLACKGDFAAPLDIRLSDVVPTVTDTLDGQIRAWFGRTMAEGLALLASQAEEQFGQSGY